MRAPEREEREGGKKDSDGGRIAKGGSWQTAVSGRLRWARGLRGVLPSGRLGRTQNLGTLPAVRVLGRRVGRREPDCIEGNDERDDIAGKGRKRSAMRRGSGRRSGRFRRGEGRSEDDQRT
jgi:hypothetical protein